jgi:hypothetical protein
LRRRAARIPRPARVRIRRRNPWVLARRRLFGWNVRLLTAKLHQQEGKGTLTPPARRRPVERTVAARPGQTAACHRRPVRSRRHAGHRPQIRRWLWRTACWPVDAAVSVRRHRLFPSSPGRVLRPGRCTSSRVCRWRFRRTCSTAAPAYLGGPQSVDAHVDEGQRHAHDGGRCRLCREAIWVSGRATVGEQGCQRR